MAVPIANMHLMVMNLAIERKILLESILTTWDYPFPTNFALCLTILPNTSLLVQNTYLHHTILWYFGRRINSHVPLATRKSYTSCIEAFYLLVSSYFMRLYKFKKLTRDVTLVHFTSCQGKIWFFYHSPSEQHSSVRYICFSPNPLTSKSFYASSSPCLLICDMGISHVFLALLNIFTKNNQRCFERFVHSVHHKSFIFSTWTHLHIVPSTHIILHEYNNSNSADHFGLVCMHMSLSLWYLHKILGTIILYLLHQVCSYFYQTPSHKQCIQTHAYVKSKVSSRFTLI